MRALSVMAVVVTALAAAATGMASTKPVLRVGGSAQLSLVGAGFKPRALVTLRVVSPKLDRRVVIRTGSRGGFTHHFPTMERCEPAYVIARAANGSVARVPVVWFTRACIAAPPLEPGPPPVQPGIANA